MFGLECVCVCVLTRQRQTGGAREPHICVYLVAELEEANVVVVGGFVELRVEDGVDGLVLLASRLDGKATDVFSDDDTQVVHADTAVTERAESKVIYLSLI